MGSLLPSVLLLLSALVPLAKVLLLLLPSVLSAPLSISVSSSSSATFVFSLCGSVDSVVCRVNWPVGGDDDGPVPALLWLVRLVAEGVVVLEDEDVDVVVVVVAIVVVVVVVVVEVVLVVVLIVVVVVVVCVGASRNCALNLNVGFPHPCLWVYSGSKVTTGLGAV